MERRGPWATPRGADAKPGEAFGGVLQPSNHFHSHPRHQRHALTGLERLLRIGGGTVEAALLHTLHDGRDAEEGEGEAISPRRNARDAHPLAVLGHILLLRGNAERLAVDAAKA